MLSNLSSTSFNTIYDSYQAGCSDSKRSISIVERSAEEFDIRDIAKLNASVDEKVLSTTINNYLYQNVFRQFIICNLVDNNIEPTAQVIDRYILPLFVDYFTGDILEFSKLPVYTLPDLSESSGSFVSIPLSDIKEYYKDYFLEDFFDSFMSITVPGSPVMGKGELFLSILTNLKNSTSHGDLMLDGELVEVKGPRGKLGGTFKNEAAGSITRHKGKDAASNIKYILNVINKEFYSDELDFKLKTYYGSTGRKVFDAICMIGFSHDSLDSPEMDIHLRGIVYELQNYIKWRDDLDIPDEIMDAFRLSIKQGFVGKFAAALHGTLYQQDEKFTRLILLSGYKYEECRMLYINVNDICLLDLYRIFIKENVHNEGGWANSSQEMVSYSIRLRNK